MQKQIIDAETKLNAVFKFTVIEEETKIHF